MDLDIEVKKAEEKVRNLNAQLEAMEKAKNQLIMNILKAQGALEILQELKGQNGN